MINNARRVKTPGNVLMAKSPCLAATPVCCVLPYRGNRKQVGNSGGLEDWRTIVATGHYGCWRDINRAGLTL